MTEAMIEGLSRISVPRYTSYPTAADFSAAVGPENYSAWLSALDPNQPVSLYLHIPYCTALCHYCGCHAKAVRRQAPIDGYRQTLIDEIALVARKLPARIGVSRIAWGGGTPSILGADGLATVVAALRQAFDILPEAEHSIELDPRTLTDDLCQALGRLGVTRASLGVQDLDPAVQQAIGRIQPLDMVASAVKKLRAAGIANVNFDLIYGLPRQTEEGLTETCRQVAALAPDRIAFYGYAHLPTRRANQRLIDEADLPDPSSRVHLSAIISGFFAENGYQPIGIDHFALPADPLSVAARQGRLHRNFQGYTDDPSGTLIGFGCSSISRLPGGYAQSEPGIEAYRRLIEAGTLPTKRGHAFGGDDAERAAIIERLMCDFSVDLGDHAPAYADELALLRPFVSAGLVDTLALGHGKVALTERGRPFTRVVSALFDRYRTENRGLFSLSV